MGKPPSTKTWRTRRRTPCGAASQSAAAKCGSGPMQVIYLLAALPPENSKHEGEWQPHRYTPPVQERCRGTASYKRSPRRAKRSTNNDGVRELKGGRRKEGPLGSLLPLWARRPEAISGRG